MNYKSLPKSIIAISKALRLILNPWVVLTIISLNLLSSLYCQNLPLGYKSYFSHTCNNNSLFDFILPEFTKNFSIVKDGVNRMLQMKPGTDSLSTSLPECRSVLDNMIFGDYILEFEMKSTDQRTNDTAGFCFLGPVKSSELYYSIIFSGDTLHFFSVQNDSILRAEVKSAPTLNPSWNKIRIERDILSRTLQITINNEIQKSLIFSDRNLVMGYIGFGSHKTTSFIRNIKLWAPTAFDEKGFQW